MRLLETGKLHHTCAYCMTTTVGPTIPNTTTTANQKSIQRSLAQLLNRFPFSLILIFQPFAHGFRSCANSILPQHLFLQPSGKVQQQYSIWIIHHRPSAVKISVEVEEVFKGRERKELMKTSEFSFIFLPPK